MPACPVKKRLYSMNIISYSVPIMLVRVPGGLSQRSTLRVCSVGLVSNFKGDLLRQRRVGVAGQLDDNLWEPLPVRLAGGFDPQVREQQQP
jgi:hypothetical protein